MKNSSLRKLHEIIQYGLKSCNALDKRNNESSTRQSNLQEEKKTEEKKKEKIKEQTGRKVKSEKLVEKKNLIREKDKPLRFLRFAHWNTRELSSFSSSRQPVFMTIVWGDQVQS
jgi:hypothetical protein